MGLSAMTDIHFEFTNQSKRYNGKVRDVYTLSNDLLVMVVSDRISAFDVVLPKGIPYKGQVLNQIASEFLDATSDILPNWKIATPDPMVTIGHHCEPYPIEMVIRGYLTGHAWREYKEGKRTLCRVPMPNGMIENQKFHTPIITPTTKAQEGHDEDISRIEIISQGLVTAKEYTELERYTMALFQRGTEMVAEKGLILVDTKYEFGKKNGQIYLIDEIHTPDSSRYFYADGYKERQAKGASQKQLSKEFVREWLMENGFQGKKGQTMPEMSEDFIREVSERYIELYEKMLNKKFEKGENNHLEQRIKDNVEVALKGLL